MHKFKIVIFTACVLLIFILLSYKFQVTLVEKKSTPDLTSGRQTINENHKSKTEIVKNKSSDSHSERTPGFYSDNPVLNHAIIETLYNECFEYFKNNNSFNKSKQSEIFNQQLDAFYRECEKINAEHPEFLLYDWQQFAQNKNNNNLMTPLDKLIKARHTLNKTNNEGLKIIKNLKFKNPNILLVRRFQVELYDYYIRNFLADLYALLNTQHEWYVSSIFMYSEILLACELGAECGKNSHQLLLKCFENDAFCGLNSYEELIKTTLTSSQQQDIYLVVEYLAELFAIEHE